MSKIKNGGLDQYGKVQSLCGIGGEWVKVAVTETRRVLYINEHDSLGSTVADTLHDFARRKMLFIITNIN